LLACPAKRKIGFGAMTSMFATLRAKGRGLSVGQFASKAIRVVRETTAARIFLRGCTKVGPGARVDGRTRVRNLGRIELGERVSFISRWAPVALSAGPQGVLTIGDGCSINYGTLLSAAKRVQLGRGVMIGNYCVISDTIVPGSGEPPQPIEIGDDVWLAIRVTVMPGSKIGAGAVISAGSVVDGEIPPGVLAAGVPARVLRPAVQPAVPQDLAS